MIVGIDPSSFKLAVAAYDDTLKFVGVVKLRAKGKAWDVEHSYDYFAQADKLFASIGLSPGDHVFLEEPLLAVGRKMSPKTTVVSSYVSGMVQVLAGFYGARLTLVNNKAWKKKVVGNGNAKKEDTIAFLRAFDSRLEGMCGDDDDLYDAVGLALYGVSTTRDS